MAKRMLFALGIVALFAVPALAGECPVCKYADSDDYPVKVPGMLLRGAANIGLSWYEIFDHAIERTKDNTPIVGTFIGLFEGAYYAIDRAVRGVIDVGGALIPGYHGAPPADWPCPLHSGGPGAPPLAAASASPGTDTSVK